MLRGRGDDAVLSVLTSGRVEDAVAVLLLSLAFLPRVTQRQRLRPWQILLFLASPDRTANAIVATKLGLRLFHVDANRGEEVADTVMALFLGLLRHTHLLSRHACLRSRSKSSA